MFEQPTISDDMTAAWGGLARVAQFPLEEPVLQSQQTDPGTWGQYRSIREWAWPEGLVDQLAITLLRDRTASAVVSFAQPKSMTITPRIMDELRLLAPHLRRAAAISRILDDTAERAATFEAALDATQAGAVLVRGDMQIVHANAAADTMLRGGDPIRSADGRLQLAEALAPGHLEASVEAASAGAATLGRRGIGIPARGADGSPLVAHVMPLEARSGAKIDADAVVFVADTGGAEPLPSESLERLFGLTPAEARIFELIGAGQAPASVAATLGIAPSTVKTHLLRVFAKTGAKRQVDLVKLATNLSLPV
jgi:DNA-binding CsgD family transcriptional regulator/PAS domain-containing protein